METPAKKLVLVVANRWRACSAGPIRSCPCATRCATSKWLRRDLVHKIEGPGLPVTTVTPTRSLRDAVDGDDVKRGLVLGGGGGG